MERIVFPTIQQTIRKLKDDNTFERQWGTLLDYDIISEEDVDKIFVNRLMKGDESVEISQQEKRAIGCFVGSAIGDALGNQTDQYPIDYSRDIIKSFDSLNDLRCPRALYTDDTSLALCLADSLLSNKLQFVPSDIRHRFVLWWFESYNNGKREFFKEDNKGKEEYSLKEVKQIVKDELWNEFSFGIGITTFNSFLDFVQNPSKSRIKEFTGDQNSNGSLMRLSPIPILFHDDINQAIEMASNQSYLTNDGEEAAECCILLSYIIVKLINSDLDGVKSAKEKIDIALQKVVKELELNSCVKSISISEQEQKFHKDNYNQCIEDRNWDWRNDNFKYSPTRSENSPTGIGAYCMDALAMALHLNYHSSSFSQVVYKAANIGGDADTVGCISGMIAGAIYGLDKDILTLHSFIYPSEKNNTALRAYKLFHKKSIS